MALVLDTMQSGSPTFPALATTTSLRLAVLLATTAGFLDAYSYVDRGRVFATAQTANVALFGIRASAGDWIGAARCLPPVLTFAVGVALAHHLQREAERGALRAPARLVISLEIAVLVVVGFLPEQFPDVIVLTALAFVAGLQGAMFATVLGWSYSSILVGGNLRTMTHSLYRAVVDHERGAAKESGSFALLIAVFAAGAAIGGLLSLHLHGRAIWIAAGLLAGTFALYSLAKPSNPAPG